jgi:hypothetical protein
VSGNVTYRVEVVTGSIEVSRPTGAIVTDRDGWNSFEMTDSIERDDDGREVARFRCPALVQWRDPT